MNPLRELQRYGQSVWLDYIRRSLITGGELERLVREDGLRGVTSNPTIFDKAISGSSDYDDAIGRAIDNDPDISEKLLFEAIAVEDIQLAADILRPVYDETDGRDGFVSMEVSPLLAHDTKATIEEAHRLWKRVSRPNLMIKVPATREGIPAIESLISDGINVNITLMFSMAHYEAVAKAYIRGLERAEKPERIASVASFFVSRVDTAVDRILDEIGTPEALSLKGRIAIANAKNVYRRFREIFYGDGFSRLQKKGARVQRPLWASTGTKNPLYSDVLYVESLIGEDTVNTLPPATLNAFRDHGKVAPTLTQGMDEALDALEALKKIKVSLEEITERLQEDGVRSFAASFDKLMDSLKEKRCYIITKGVQRLRLDAEGYMKRIEERVNTWKEEMFSCRLWKKDYTIWSPTPQPEITDRLGWLHLPETMLEEAERIKGFADRVKARGMERVVLLGMGGSSLAPEVFQKIFGNASGYPELTVLDTTHPVAIESLERSLDLKKTLFLVSSKSGTTLETLSLFRYFWHRMGEVVEDPEIHFVAITDPGTPLEVLGRERGFLQVFLAPPDIGGRYSALSHFGLVPAALIGIDIHRLLDNALTMQEGCAFCVPESESHCLLLGATLGELAGLGRDKVTFLSSPSLSSFPSWLEQLIAESTGKDGKGIIPVADEPIGVVDDYGDDRFFVHLYLEGEEDSGIKTLLEELVHRSAPVAHIRLSERYEIAQEMFRWEVAVASAGAIIGIHPFNQPDVQLAKDLAKRAMEGERTETKGSATLEIEREGDVKNALEEMMHGIMEGDYIAFQAYLPPSTELSNRINGIRSLLLKRKRVATTSGYGPRFLHSTGQLHKGGPDTGISIQLVDRPAKDLPVPGTDYTFSTLIKAQALGDFNALRQRGRRVIRIDLGEDTLKGIEALHTIFNNL